MYTYESFSGVGESFTVCIDARLIRNLCRKKHKLQVYVLYS